MTDYSTSGCSHHILPHSWKHSTPWILSGAQTSRLFCEQGWSKMNISFKKVFAQIMDFNISVDNLAFTLKANSESIRP